MTVSDVQRLEATTGDADVAFVMDEDAFRAFYDRTARSLWAYLARVTGDRSLAEDLVQETFYRFLRASAPYENEAHRRNALYRIATNLARDAHRRSRTRPRTVSSELEIAGPDRGAARVDQATDLARAMRGLKTRERALLWLAYGEGSSHQEIAQTMGLAPSSVKMMLFRARRRLAAILTARSTREGRPA